MNMKKLFVIVVAAILSATVAHADNVYDNMEPLRLTTPAMEPKLDYAASTLYRPELELRMMPLPPIDTIREIGRKIILRNNYSIDFINDLVLDYFKIR